MTATSLPGALPKDSTNGAGGDSFSLFREDATYVAVEESAWVVGEGGIVTINPGDAPGDIALHINAALADPAVTEVHLGEGLFLVSSAIVVPSGKALVGAGRDLTLIQADPDFEPISAQHNGVVNSAWGATGVSLSDFAVDAGKILPDGLRINGVMMKQATDFTVERVDVSNATGYAHYAQGDLGGQTIYASGTYEDCRTYNSQVHFEQMFCDGVTLINCHASDGDNDISTEAYFHPLAGSKNITFIGSSAYGNGFIGFSLVSTVRPLENIRIIDCDVEIVRVRSGFGLASISGLPTIGLEIVDSTFISRNYIAISIAGTSGTATRSEFRGGVIGVEAGPLYDGTENAFVLTDSIALGLSGPLAAVGVYGVANYGTAESLTFVGGSIEALGARGYMFPISGQVGLSETTQVVKSGFAGGAVYREDGPAVAIFEGVTVNGLTEGSFAGGSLSVELLNQVESADALFIRVPSGSEAQGLELVGNELRLDGNVIGTVEMDAGGRTIDILFGPDVSADELAAVIASISFATSPDEPSTTYRPVSLVLTDSSGQAHETDLAVYVQRSDDAVAIDLASAAPTAVEDGDSILVAPELVLTDPDNVDYDGASLIVSVVDGAPTERLNILPAEGGDLTVSGDSLLWQGVEIGSVSGAGTAAVTVDFATGAPISAIETVMRSITFALDTDVPPAGREISFVFLQPGGRTSIATATVTIVPTDDAPLARADEIDVSEHGIVTGSLFDDHGAGADDPDGGEALVVTEVDGSAHSVGQEIVLASGATLQVGADGTFLYDPAGRFDLAGADRGAANSRALDSFTYTLANGGTATVTVNVLGVDDASDILIGSSGDDLISGADFGHHFRLESGGDDSATGGAGSDVFRFGSAFTSADLVDGGGALDALLLQGNYAGTRRVALSGLSEVELIMLMAGSDTSFGDPGTGRYSYDVLGADLNVAAGASLTIDARALRIGEKLFFDGSAETDGTLKLYGGGGDDFLTGGAGGDILDGAIGTDTLAGGDGGDIYYVDSFDFIAGEGAGQGSDSVYTRTSFGLRAGVEIELLATTDHLSTEGLRLVGNEYNNSIIANAGNNAIYGGAGSDSIHGLAGNDVLDGQDGTDYLIGGRDNDIYYVDGLDSAVEAVGEGYDTVYARTSYTLNPESEVEMLATADYRLTIAISLSGNQLNNNIVGNNGDNILDGRSGDDSLRALDGDDLLIGGSGIDYMIGGTGSDDYYVTTDDRVIELAGEGDDAVYASSSYVLTSGSEVELLGILDSRSEAEIDLAGNEFDQSVFGSNGANMLRGLGGADKINALAGDDRIDGGEGQDYLQGGTGADTFLFAAIDHSSVAFADTIADFESGIDRIDLSAIDADSINPGNDPFAFIGGDAFTGKAGELRIEGTTGVFHLLGDIDGDGVADFKIVIQGDLPVAGDFAF